MVVEELLCVCIDPVSCMLGNNNNNKLSYTTDAGRCILLPEDAAVWLPRLTLLWYPEGFCVSRHHLMHDSTELIQHLQALLLPHAGVVESWESWLKGGADVRQPDRNATPGRTVASCVCSDAFLTFVASVRMSLESFTRHCSGTVTSMTFALSCLLLLSVTNLPYQALRMMRPGLKQQR